MSCCFAMDWYICFTPFSQGETALHIAVRKASFDVAGILRRTREGERLKQIRNKVDSLPVACIAVVLKWHIV